MAGVLELRKQVRTPVWVWVHLEVV
jgi:hypothetical protein